MKLRAGDYELLYDGGSLRKIKYQGVEVVRMIYFALRDHNWGTFDKIISDEHVETDERSFKISYTCINVTENQVPVFEWKVELEGTAAGAITAEIEGTALQDIRRNRAGFCILHPIEGVAGQPVTIVHENGTESTSHFPKYIAPDDPFLMIRSMKWEMAGGTKYQMDVEGDTFETEDQRNWGDASYKTFCTPLSKPYPVQLHKGDSVWQRVRLQPPVVQGNRPCSVPINPTVAPSSTFEWGIAASIETNDLAPEVVKKLKTLALSHYRIDLDVAAEGWMTDFSTYCENAYQLELPLEVALTVSDEESDQLDEFIGLCQYHRLNVKRVMLFSRGRVTTSQTLIELIPHLKSSFPTAQWGVGTNFNFTELNRNRFDPQQADFVTFSYHPQVHAFDSISILENAETLQYQVESAEYLCQKPVHINFISLRARANPYASSSADVLIPIAKQIDARQKEDFAKDWLSAIFESLSHSSVASVTLLRTVGELGLMTPAGDVYPLFEIFSKKN